MHANTIAAILLLRNGKGCPARSSNHWQLQRLAAVEPGYAPFRYSESYESGNFPATFFLSRESGLRKTEFIIFREVIDRPPFSGRRQLLKRVPRKQTQGSCTQQRGTPTPNQANERWQNRSGNSAWRSCTTLLMPEIMHRQLSRHLAAVHLLKYALHLQRCSLIRSALTG